MHVVFHIGAHCTGEDRLLKSLLKNRDSLSRNGTVVPGPSRYRRLIRQTLRTMGNHPPTPQEQQDLLAKITNEPEIRRLVLSAADFLAYAPWVFRHKTLYGQAAQVIPALTNLFAHSRVEFHLGIRNPATFIPAVYARTTGLSFDKFLYGANLNRIKWSDLIHTIHSANPDAGITIWCNEDCPLIWPKVMYGLIGHTPSVALHGETDLLANIMTVEGILCYREYLRANPPKSEARKQRITGVFLEKFSIPEKIEQVLDLPNWTQDMVDDLTDQYEEDLQEIAAIPGARLISP